MATNFKGVGVALVTPFTAAGAVDYPALTRLLKHTAQGGVDYYVVHGTTGESVTTTPEEKAKIIAHVQENNPNNLPVVVGLGGSNTASLQKLIQKLPWEGIDAILSVSPSYNLPTQEGLYQHYLQIAEIAPRPVILYNVPARTARNLEAETTLRLAEHQNIIGIKEASKDLNQAMHIARSKPDNFELISGDDMLSLPLISVGGIGVISVIANALPQVFSKMVHYALENKWPEAQQQLYSLLDINELLYKEGNPAGVKQALCELGICEPAVRLPLVGGTKELKSKMNIALKALQ